MRLIKLRAISVATSLALLAGAAGFGSLASAATGGPTVVLSSATASVTNSTSIPITATFSEGVNGFTSSGITVTNGSISGFSGSGATFTFNVVPIANGTVTVMANADAATSTTSVGSQASNTLTFTFDNVPPTVSRTVTVTDTTATLNVTTSEPTTGFVSFGTTTPFTASTTLGALATTHVVTLTGLQASTTYQYEINVFDQAGNQGTSGQLAFTTGASVVGLPTISNITQTPSSTSALLEWDTAAAATSQVFFGLSVPYSSSTTLDSNLVMHHAVTLAGLQASTTYHYQLQSTNSAGTATSADRTFTTLAATSSVVLAVNGVDSVNGTALPDGSFANGFKWVLHLTVPNSETSFSMKFNDFSSAMASTTIPIAGNLRIFSAQSSNASTESSAITETDNNFGGTLNLTGDTSSTTPGRQIDVTVELRVPVGTQPGVYSTLFGARSL